MQTLGENTHERPELSAKTHRRGPKSDGLPTLPGKAFQDLRDLSVSHTQQLFDEALFTVPREKSKSIN